MPDFFMLKIVLLLRKKYEFGIKMKQTQSFRAVCTVRLTKNKCLASIANSVVGKYEQHPNNSK